MVKATIRGASSQSRVTTPALQSIILSSNAETTLIEDYFRTKKLQGTRAVPKPVICGPVITKLMEKLKNSSDMSTCVSCIVMCLEEFSSNFDVVKEWHPFFKETAQLVFECLAYFIEVKRRDQKQMTTNFVDASRTFSKLCYVIYYLADKSADLSTELFNSCSKYLLVILISNSVNSEMRAILLQALSALCNKAKALEIKDTFLKLPIYMNCLAKMIASLGVETQMDAYTIFHTSVLNEDDAVKKASVWFGKWPTVQDAFIKSYPLCYSKGCGVFLGSLHKLKATTDTPGSSIGICSLAPSTRYMEKDTKQRFTIGHVVDTKSTFSSKKLETPITQKSENVIPRKVSVPNLNVANMPKAVTTDVPLKNSKKCDFQTPYYPDGRKSLSLQKRNRFDLVKPARDTQAEQFQNSSGLKSSATTNTAKEVGFRNADQKPKDISSKRLGVPTTPTASLQSKVSYPASNVGNTSSTTPAIVMDKSQKNSTSVFQTPYYPDSRKSLSLRNKNGKDQNKPVSSKQTEQLRRDSALNFSEDPNTSKKIVMNNNAPELKVKKNKYDKVMPLHPKPEPTKLAQSVQNHRRFSLSSLSSEDQSSKVEKWLSSHDTISLQNPDDELDTVVISTDDENPHDKISDVRKTESQKQPAAKIEDSPAMVSFSSDISHSKTAVKAPSIKNDKSVLVKKSRPGGRAVHFKPDAENEAPPAKRKKDTSSSFIDFSACQSKNLWEKRLKELEQNRAEEKQQSKDIYCFNAAVVTTAPFKTPGRPVSASRRKTHASKKISSSHEPAKSQKSSRTQKADISTSHELGKTQKSSRTKNVDILENKENLRPKGQSLKVRKVPDKIPESNVNLVEPSGTSSTKQAKEEMKSCTTDSANRNSSELSESGQQQYFSPVIDDSFEKKKSNKEKREGETPAKTENRSSKRKPDALQSATENSKSCPPLDLIDSNRNNQESVLQGDIKSQWRHIFHGDKLSEPHNKDEKGIKTFPESKQAKDVLGDSGFEVTSGSDGGSKYADEKVTVSRKKYSTKSENLKNYLRINLQKSLETNTNVISDSEAMTSEINEIKTLAKKISESAGRCLSTNTSNCQQLREQHKALEGCSNYLGPYEDQTFKASVPAPRYMDFKAFHRHLKERSRQRTIDAIRQALELSSSSSSSDDSDDEP